MKHKGTPRYTQHTVAWPTLPRDRSSIVDEINISFNAKGGGTHGEFMIEFYDFGDTGLRGSHHPAVQFKVFTESISAFYDERIQKLVFWIRSKKTDARNEITPEEMIAKLEELGVGPSKYHLQGLIDSRASLEKRVDARNKLRREIAWENA